MTERYTIFSEAGDEYRLQFTTDRSNIIADRILDLLLQDGIEVVEVGLGRVGSTNVTSHRVLQQIEESIADFMTRNPNAILSYMCDFINLVPILPQPSAITSSRTPSIGGGFSQPTIEVGNEYRSK